MSPRAGALGDRVLSAVRTIGRGARLGEIAAVASCQCSEAAEALCELEGRGLVAVWSWAPTTPDARRGDRESRPGAEGS